MLHRAACAGKSIRQKIIEQTRRNGDDIAAINTCLNRVEEKVDGLDRKLDGLDRKIDGMGRKVDALAQSIPGIVRDALSDYEIKSTK